MLIKSRGCELPVAKKNDAGLFFLGHKAYIPQREDGPSGSTFNYVFKKEVIHYLDDNDGSL